MKLRRLLATCALIAVPALVAAGCSGGPFGGIPSDAICTVYGEAVLKKDYAKLEDQAKASYKAQGQEFPKKSSEQYDAQKKQWVDFLIKQKVTEHEAEDLDVKVSDKAVNKRLKEVKESFFGGKQEDYEKELKKQGLTEADVKDVLRDQLLNEKVFEEVAKGVKVGDKEAKEYYEKNKEEFTTPESREVAHILVKTKAEADKVYAQVKGASEKEFGEVAKEKSQDPGSKDSGGVLTVSRGQTVPEFDKKAFELKVGEVSEPVKTQFGYHVITARGEVQPESKQTFDEAKAQIVSQLEQQAKSERMQDWNTDVLKDAEKEVECKKGYVWTQTVTETAEEAPPEATPPAETPDESSDDAKKEDDAAASDDKAASDSGEDK